MITKKVVFIAKDDCIEELKKMLKDMVNPSKQEAGASAYDIYQVIDNPQKFVVIESWENEESLEGHRNSSHYEHYKKNFEVFCKEKYSEEMNAL